MRDSDRTVHGTAGSTSRYWAELPPLVEVLRSGRVLLMDGAMGTELQRLGLPTGDNAAAWTFLHPERVEAVHRAYRDAGAEVLLTNTFLMLASSFRETLARAGQAPPAGAVAPWREACARIGPEPCYRLASVGPITGHRTDREFDDLSCLRISDLCPACSGYPCPHIPSAILLETCSTPRVRLALARLRRSTLIPLLLSLSYHRDTRGRLVTASGHSPEWFAQRAAGFGAAALGVNCGREISMDDIIEIVRRYHQATDLPLFARPNAGTPVREGASLVYPQTPQQMADHLWELLEACICMVGGCCGTTPSHIAAFRKIVDAWNARSSPKAE
jgi:methionine synthase I (cobalamin-dependent)